jgi:hypothetical protein
MSQSDDEGRSESSPYGQGSTAGGGEYEQQREHGQEQYGQEQPYGQPEYGQQQYGQQQYGQGSPYGQQQPYEQPQYGQPPYGQPSPYGQQYGQQPYGQEQYGQTPYGQYGPYGQSAVPARPGGVVTAAVLGFIFGALGVLVSLVFIVGGAAATGAAGAANEDLLGLGEFAGAVGGLFIVAGVLALIWTVVMIWGSVWALTGRSRVMLLVGGSIGLAFTLLGFLANLSNSANATAGGVFWNVLVLAAAIAIVVLLSIKPAADFYAAHRARRGVR